MMSAVLLPGPHGADRLTGIQRTGFDGGVVTNRRPVRRPRLGCAQGLACDDGRSQHTMGCIGPSVAERSGQNRVIGRGRDERVDVVRMRNRFRCRHEPSTHSNPVGAGGKCGGHRPTGSDTSGSDDRNVHCGVNLVEQRQQPSVASHVAPSLDPLGNDDITTNVHRGVRLVGGADLPTRLRSTRVHELDEIDRRIAPEELDEGTPIRGGLHRLPIEKGIRKFTPTAEPTAITSICARSASLPTVPVSIPNAPASATAIVSCGEVDPPIPAC